MQRHLTLLADIDTSLIPEGRSQPDRLRSIQPGVQRVAVRIHHRDAKITFLGMAQPPGALVGLWLLG